MSLYFLYLPVMTHEVTDFLCSMFDVLEKEGRNVIEIQCMFPEKCTSLFIFRVGINFVSQSNDESNVSSLV